MNSSLFVNRYIKYISIFIVIAFCSQEVTRVYASPTVPTASSIPSSALRASHLKALLRDPMSLSFPADHAHLKEIYSGESGHMVIFIEDAHANFGAQQHLSQTIDYLMNRYGIEKVLSEGGSGDMSLTAVKKTLRHEDLEIGAKALLYDGQIAGHEYLNLVSDLPMRIIGIEDMDLYQQNLQAFDSLKQSRHQILSYIREIHQSIRSLKNEMYPRELIAYENKVPSHQSEEQMPQYEALLDLAVSAGISAEKYGVISQYLNLQQLERLIDFEKVNDELSSVITAADAAANLHESSGFGITPMRQLQKIEAILEMHPDIARPAALPNVYQYLHYLRAFKEINFSSLIEEFEQLEREVYQQILKTNETHNLYEIEKFVKLLEGAYSIRLNADEYRWLYENRDFFRTASWQAFLNEQLAINGRYQDLIGFRKLIDDTQEKIDSFYELVSKRDDAFVDNIEKELLSGNSRPVITVAGGYHTQNLTALLKERGISYAVLSPQVDNGTDFEKYETLLLASLKSQSRYTLSQVLAGDRKAASRLAAFIAKNPDRVAGQLAKEILRIQKAGAPSAAARLAEENNPGLSENAVGYTVLGGDTPGSGSGILLKLPGNQAVLLDLGLDAEKIGKGSESDLTRALGGHRLIGAVISHAHTDHSESAPWFHKYFPDVPVIASETTARMLPVMWNDSLQFQRGEWKVSKSDNTKAIQSVTHIKTNQWYQLSRGVKIYLANAGHIPGATSVFIATPDGNILYTGDTSVLPNASLNANDIVPTAQKTDLVISESTNGDRIQSETFEQRRKLLIQTVQETVDRKGSVLIPAFALGRSGEAAIILDQAIQNGELKLPQDSGIYLDGMAREIARKLRRDPAMQAYAGLMGPGSSVKPVEDEDQRKTILAKIKKGQPQILIAGSGMLSGGLAVRYFEMLASDPKHQLITVGYQAPGTLGSKILSGSQNTAINPDGSHEPFEVQWEDNIYRKRKGEKIQKTKTVQMGVRSISLSGHAMQDELVELLFDLNAYLTLLVHGDVSAKEALMNHEMLQHLTFINRQNSGLQNGDEILSRLPDRSKEFDEIQSVALPEPNQPLPDRLENQLNSAVDDWINEFINTGALDWNSQEEMERIEDLLLFYFQSSKNLSKLDSDLLNLYADQIGDPGQLIVWLDAFRRDELDKRSRSRQEKVRDPILKQPAPQKTKKKDQTADLEEKLIVEWTRKVRDYFIQHPSDIFGTEENANLELAATLFFKSGITVYGIKALTANLEWRWNKNPDQTFILLNSAYKLAQALDTEMTWQPNLIYVFVWNYLSGSNDPARRTAEYLKRITEGENDEVRSAMMGDAEGEVESLMIRFENAGAVKIVDQEALQILQKYFADGKDRVLLSDFAGDENLTEAVDVIWQEFGAETAWNWISEVLPKAEREAVGWLEAFERKGIEMSFDDAAGRSHFDLLSWYFSTSVLQQRHFRSGVVGELLSRFNHDENGPQNVLNWLYYSQEWIQKILNDRSLNAPEVYQKVFAYFRSDWDPVKLHQVLVLKDHESSGDGAWGYIRSLTEGSRLSDESAGDARKTEKPAGILRLSLEREELAQISPDAAVKALSILRRAVALTDEYPETAGDVLASLTATTVLGGLLDVMWGGGIFTSLIAAGISYFMAQLKPLSKLSLHLTDQGLKSKWSYFRVRAAEDFVFSLNRALIHPDFRVRAVAYEISRSLSEAFVFSEFEHAFNINRDTFTLSSRGNAPWIDPKEAYREEIFEGKSEPLRYVPVTDAYDPYQFKWIAGAENAARLADEDPDAYNGALQYRTDPDLLKEDIEYFVDNQILPGLEKYDFYREDPSVFRGILVNTLIENAFRRQFSGRDVAFGDDDFGQQQILIELFGKKIREKMAVAGADGSVSLALMEVGVGSTPSELSTILDFVKKSAKAAGVSLQNIVLTIVGIDGDSIHAKTAASYLDVRSYVWNRDGESYSAIPVVYEINALDQNGLNKARHDAVLRDVKFDFIFARNIGPSYLNRAVTHGIFDLSKYKKMTAQEAAEFLKSAITSWSIVTNIAYTFSTENQTYLITEPGDNFAETQAVRAVHPQFETPSFRSMTFNELRPAGTAHFREESTGNLYSGITLYTGKNSEKQKFSDFAAYLYPSTDEIDGSRLSDSDEFKELFKNQSGQVLEYLLESKAHHDPNLIDYFRRVDRKVSEREFEFGTGYRLTDRYQLSYEGASYMFNLTYYDAFDGQYRKEIEKSIVRENRINNIAADEGVAPQTYVIDDASGPMLFSRYVDGVSADEIQFNLDHISQLASLLGNLHAKGIVHNDLTIPGYDQLRSGNLLQLSDRGESLWIAVDYEYSELETGSHANRRKEAEKVFRAISRNLKKEEDADRAKHIFWEQYQKSLSIGARLSEGFNWEQGEVASSYSAFAANTFYQTLNQELVRMANPQENQTWLDLGSGTGSGSALLSRWVGEGGRVIGVDGSAEMTDWAQTHSVNPQTEFRTGFAENMAQLIPENIDGVIAFNSIHLMSDPDRVLSAAAEKLPDGGTFAFNTNFFTDPSVRSNDPNAVMMMTDIVGKVNRYADRQSERPKRRRIKLKSPSDYRDLFEQNGFENIILQQEKIDIPIEALQSFYRVPGMASTLVPYEIPDDIAEEIVLSALEDLKKQGINTLSRTWLLATAQKKPAGSRLAAAQAADLYRKDYDQIMAATAGLTELTESDIERSRLILDKEGKIRPFAELSEAYVPGATEVYMVPRSEVRRYLASVQEELAAHPVLGKKFYFVKPDNLHLTIQGLEQIPDSLGELKRISHQQPKEQADVSGEYYQQIKKRAEEIVTVQSRIQIGGLNWSPDIGLFWEVRPYVGDGETDLLTERRALWDISSTKNPFHITAAYFKEPFSAEELNEFRKFVSAHRNPLTTGYVQINNAQIVLYDDFAFDSGYRTIHQTGFLGNFSRSAAVSDLRNLYQGIDEKFNIRYQEVMQAHQSGENIGHIFNPARIKRMRDNFEQDAEGNLIKDIHGAVPSKTDIYSTFISVGTNEPIKRLVEGMNRRLIEALSESHDYYSVPGNTLHVSVFVAKEGRGEDKDIQPEFSDESRFAYLDSLQVITQLISPYTLRLKEFKLSMEDGSIIAVLTDGGETKEIRYRINQKNPGLSDGSGVKDLIHITTFRILSDISPEQLQSVKRIIDDVNSRLKQQAIMHQVEGIESGKESRWMHREIVRESGGTIFLSGANSLMAYLRKSAGPDWNQNGARLADSGTGREDRVLEYLSDRNQELMSHILDGEVQMKILQPEESIQRMRALQQFYNDNGIMLTTDGNQRIDADDETYVLQAKNESVLPRVVTEGDMEWTVFKTRSSQARMIRGTPVRMISDLHIFTVSYKGEVIMEGIFNREPMQRSRLTQFMFFKRPNEEDPKAYTIIPFILKNIYNYMGRDQIQSIETNPGSLYAERNGMQYRYMLQSKIFNFFARQGFSPVINHAAIDDYEGSDKMTYLKALDVAQNAEPIASMSVDDANKVLSVHPMEFYFLPSGSDENSIKLKQTRSDKSVGARLTSEEVEQSILFQTDSIKNNLLPNLKPDALRRISTGKALIQGPYSRVEEILSILHLFPDLESVFVVDGQADQYNYLIEALNNVNADTSKVKFIQPSVFSNLPFEENQFDLVYANNVYDGIPTPGYTDEDVRESSLELKRILKGDGVFISLAATPDVLTSGGFTVRGRRSSGNGIVPLKRRSYNGVIIGSPDSGVFILSDSGQKSDDGSRLASAINAELFKTLEKEGLIPDEFEDRIQTGDVFTALERWFKADRRSYEEPPEVNTESLLLPSELRRRNMYVRIGGLRFIDEDLYKNLPEDIRKNAGNGLMPIKNLNETELDSDTPTFFASVSLISALSEIDLKSVRVIEAGSGHGLAAVAALAMGAKQVVLIEKDLSMLQKSADRLTALGYETDVDFIAVQGDLTQPETFIERIPDDGTGVYLASDIGYWENKSYTADNTHSLMLARLLQQRPNTHLLGYLSGGHRGSYTGNDSDDIRYGGIHAKFESQEIPQIKEAGLSAEPDSVTRFNVSELKEVFPTYLFTSAKPDAEFISKSETADGARLAALTAVPRLSNLVLAVNIVDLGVEITDGDQVIYRASFRKLSDLIDLIREMEIGKVYIYGGLYEMSPLSVYLHQQTNTAQHFIHYGKSTVMAGNYNTRKETVGGLELKDAFGNAFSILSLLKLNPNLSDTDTDQEFEELVRLLTEKNIRVMTDFIAWLSPDSVDESNYRRTMYYEIPEEQNETFRNLKTETEKQQWIDELVAEDGSWFAVRLKENGEERVIRVSHFRFFGSHSGDQAMPNPFHPEAQDYYVDALKKMIDHGVREFRVDLGHEVLKSHAGNYFELMRQKGVNLDEWIHYSGVDAHPEENFESWFARQPEPWERIISEARIYAIESCNCDISFSMETYDPADRHQLYLQGVNASYETNLFEAFQNVSRGGASAHMLDESISILIGNRPHAFGYITNFDQISLKMLQGPWRGAAMLTLLLSHFGVPMMVGKRDFMMRKGEVAKIVGSTYDESDPHHHPFASEDELALYRNFGLLQEKFADAPWKHLIDIFNSNIRTQSSSNERILNNSDRDRYQTLMWQDENGDFRIILIDFWPLTPKEAVRIEIPGNGEIKGFDPAAIEVTDSSTGKHYSTGVWDGTNVPVTNLEFDENEQNLDFRFLTIKTGKSEKTPVKTRGSPSKSRLLIESAQMLGHEYPSQRLSALRRILSDFRFESVRNEALLLAAADENPAVRALAANFSGHVSNQYKINLELDELLDHLKNPLQSYSTFRADSDLIKIKIGNERKRLHDKRSALIRGISQLVAPVSVNHSDSPERRKIINQIRDQLMSESEQDFEKNEIRLKELADSQDPYFMGADEPLSLTEMLRLIHLHDLMRGETAGTFDSWASGLVYFLSQLFESENRLDDLFEYILRPDSGSRLSDRGLESAVYTAETNSETPYEVKKRLEFFAENPSVTNDAFYLWNHKGYQPMQDSNYLQLKLREFREIAGYFPESESKKYAEASADLLSQFISRLNVDANMWVARKTPGQRPPWPVQAYLEEYPLEKSERFRELSVQIAANMRNFYAETPLMDIQIPEAAEVEQGNFPMLQEVLLRESPDLLNHKLDQGKWKLDYFSDMIYRVHINGKPYFFGSGLFVKIHLPDRESAYLYDAHNLLPAFLEDYLADGKQLQTPEHDHYDYHSDAYRYQNYQLVDPADDSELSENIRQNPFLTAQNIPIASFVPYIHDRNSVLGRNPIQSSWIGSERVKPRLDPRLDEPVFEGRRYSFSEFTKSTPGGIGDLDLDELTRGLGTGIDYQMNRDNFREHYKNKFLKLLPQYEMLAFFISDHRYIPPVLALMFLGDMLPEIIQSKLDRVKNSAARLSGISNVQSFRLPENLPEDYFILVPAFREESGLPQIIRDVQNQGYMDRVIFVDDASPDTTAEVLRSRSVSYISLRENKRKEGALVDALEFLEGVYAEKGKHFPNTFVAVDADTYLSAGKKNTQEELSSVVRKFEKLELKASPIVISANLKPDASFFEYMQGVEWSLGAAKWLPNALGVTPDLPGGGTVYDIETFKEVIANIDTDFESRPIKMKKYMQKKSYKIREIKSRLRARTDIAENMVQYVSERQKWLIGTFRGAPVLGFQRYILYPALWTIMTILWTVDSPGFTTAILTYTFASSLAWKIKHYLSRKIFRTPDEINVTNLDFVLLMPSAIILLAFSPYPIITKYFRQKAGNLPESSGARLAGPSGEQPAEEDLTAALKAIAGDFSNSLKSGHIPKVISMIQSGKVKLKGVQVPVVSSEDQIIAWVDRAIADLHFSGNKKISKKPGKHGVSLRKRNAYSLIYLPGVKKFVFMQSVSKNKKSRDIRWIGGTIEKKTGEEASNENSGYTATVVREIAEESGFEDGHEFEPVALLSPEQITGDYNPKHPKKISLYTTILNPEEESILLEHSKLLSEKRSQLGVKKFYEWLQIQKEQQPGRGEVWDLVLISPETLTDSESLKDLPVSKQFTGFIEEASVQEYIRNIPEHLILNDLQKKTNDLISYIEEMGPYFSENLLPAPGISLSKKLPDDVVYRYDSEDDAIELNLNLIKDYSQQQLDDVWVRAFLIDWYQHKLSKFTDNHFEDAADIYSDENFGERIEEQDWPFSMYGPDWLKVQEFEDKDVLVAGSGDGAFEHYLMAASQVFGITAPRITGVDGSEKFIGLSRKRALQAGYSISYVQSYFTDLSEIEDESYDVIYTAHTLYALPPQLRKTALQKLYQKIRKGGRIIVFEPLPQLIGISLAESEPWHQFISAEWLEDADIEGAYISAPAFTGGLMPAAVTVSVRKPSGARLADQGKKLFSEFKREYHDFMQAADVLLNAYPDGYDHNQMHPDGEELRSKYQRMVRKLRAFSHSWQLFGNETLSHELYEKSRDVVRIMQESEEGVFPIVIQYEQILADLQRGEWQDFSEDLGVYFTGNGLPVYRKLDDEAKSLQISLMKQHANDRLGQFEQEIQRIINRHRRAAAKDKKTLNKIHGIQLAVDDWFNLFREYPLDYPVATYVPEDKRLIETDYPGYTPVYYTDPKVLSVSEAHPEDPSLIPSDLWTLSGKINYTGPYPQNPVERTGITGRGRWWYWGPNWMTEIIITRINPKTKVTEMLAVKRRDTGQWAAIVGTHDASRNFKEDMSEAVYSKLGVRIKTSRVQEIYKGYVHDPRNTDNAWAEGYVGHLHIGANHVLNHEEFKLDRFILEAKWLPLDKLNVAGLYGDHSKHVQLLIDRNQDLLSGSRLSATPLTDMPENAPNLNINDESLRLIRQIAEHRESPQKTDLAITAGRQTVLMHIQSPGEVMLKTVSGNENRTVRFPEVDIAGPVYLPSDVMEDAGKQSEALTVFTAELTGVERSYLNVLFRLLEKNRIDDVVWVRSGQSGLYDASVEGIRRLVESEAVGGRFYSVSEEELLLQIPRFAEGNRYVTYLIPETLNTAVLENIDLSDRASSWVYPEASGNDESGYDMPAIRLNALMGLIIQAADKNKEESRSFDQAAFRLSGLTGTDMSSAREHLIASRDIRSIQKGYILKAKRFLISVKVLTGQITEWIRTRTMTSWSA